MKAWLYPSLLLAFLHSGDAAADCWKSVPTPGSLTFSATQSGAAMPGEFKSYAGSLCLDAADASKDKLLVQVDTASASTQLPELDEALRGADFFDTAHWPQAKFESDSIKMTAAGYYTVIGRLTVRDVTRSVTVPFTWVPATDGKHAKLQAALTIQRLDYRVGQGQWADTQWVGNPVVLTFTVDFVPAPK
jgi:polyisoprenoid-binding protein YceI